MLIPIAFLFSVCIFSFIWFFLERYFGSESRLQREQVIRKRIFSAGSVAKGDKSHKIEKRQAYGFLSKYFSEQSFFRKNFPLLLRRAKLPVSVSFFISATVGVALIAFFALYYNRPLLDAQILALITFIFPFGYLHIANQIYLKKFQQYLPDAITALSSSIKVGHGLQVGLESAIESAVYPVRDEFLEVQGELKLGIPIEDAFKNLYARIHTPEVRIFCMGISIHEELGGNLSEVLDNLERTIRTRFELEREISVLSSQGKFSVITISAVPFFVAGFMYFSDTQHFLSYMSSDLGRFVTKINVASVVFGTLWMLKIINLKD